MISYLAILYPACYQRVVLYNRSNKSCQSCIFVKLSDQSILLFYHTCCILVLTISAKKCNDPQQDHTIYKTSGASADSPVSQWHLDGNACHPACHTLPCVCVQGLQLLVSQSHPRPAKHSTIQPPPPSDYYVAKEWQQISK